MRQEKPELKIIDVQFGVHDAAFFERELQGVNPADQERMLQSLEADMRAILAEKCFAARGNEEIHSRTRRPFSNEVGVGSYRSLDTDQAVCLADLVELHANDSRRGVRNRGACPRMSDPQSAGEVLASPGWPNDKRRAECQAGLQYSASMMKLIHC
jgi:hypothetical protein